MKKNHKNQFVTLWDEPSNTFTQIPKSELAPGMVQCKIDGRKGLVWREALSIKLKKTPFRHPPFEGDVRAAVAFLSKAFAGVYEYSYKFWEEGFRRDMHPIPEIHRWLVAAYVYGEFAEGRSLPYRKELFRLLAVCNATPRDTLRMVFENELLSACEMEKIADAYYRHFAG